MKKILSILFILLCLPLFTSAYVDSQDWIYMFHLEYEKGVLKPSPDGVRPYSPIPMLYTETQPIDTADFYGVIINIQNKEMARFGFMTPTKIIPALGKSLLDVPAPYFADADHASFYNKAGKLLFKISLKDSSFCDDNKKCDANSGENEFNCPFDCPRTTLEPTQIPEDTNPPVTTTTPNETITETQEPVDTGFVVSEEIPQTEVLRKSNVIPMTIGLSFILLSLLGYVVWRRSRGA